MSPAPIRTTTPSLAVYKGGEVTVRYHFTQQHLGDLKVNHHEARLGYSYTPTAKLQFEGESPTISLIREVPRGITPVT